MNTNLNALFHHFLPIFKNWLLLLSVVNHLIAVVPWSLLYYLRSYCSPRSRSPFIEVLNSCLFVKLDFQKPIFVDIVKIRYSWFHIKGTWNVHSFNWDYISTSEGTGSGYLFHEIPGNKLLIFLKDMENSL